MVYGDQGPRAGPSTPLCITLYLRFKSRASSRPVDAVDNRGRPLARGKPWTTPPLVHGCVHSRRSGSGRRRGRGGRSRGARPLVHSRPQRSPGPSPPRALAGGVWTTAGTSRGRTGVDAVRHDPIPRAVHSAARSGRVIHMAIHGVDSGFQRVWGGPQATSERAGGPKSVGWAHRGGRVPAHCRGFSQGRGRRRGSKGAHRACPSPPKRREGTPLDVPSCGSGRLGGGPGGAGG